jgi:hypothetical protein
MTAPVSEQQSSAVATVRQRPEIVHSLCGTCYPMGQVRVGQTVVALCGDVDTFDLWRPPGDTPDDCVVCWHIAELGLPARSCDHFG